MTAFSFYVSDCAIFLTAVGSWGIFFLFFGAVAQLGWLSEKTPGGVFSSATSWLPYREREATATAARLGTQGEWFRSLDRCRNYFEF